MSGNASMQHAVASFSELTPAAPESGLTRRIGTYNEKLMLAEHQMVKGEVGPFALHG